MKTTIFCLFLLFSLLVLTINAQTRSISGNVSKLNDSYTPLQNVPVKMYYSYPYAYIGTTYTNDSGNFLFSSAPYDELIIYAEDGGNTTHGDCGLDTDDFNFIQTFILTQGQNSSSSDGYWRLIASDINNSFHISASDLLEVKRCYFSQDCRFPTFRMLSVAEYDDLQYWYTNNGGGFTMYSSMYQNLYIPEGNSNVSDADFYAIKLGDPTFEYCPSEEYRVTRINENVEDYILNSNISPSVRASHGQTIDHNDKDKVIIERWFSIDGKLVYEGNENHNDISQHLEGGLYVVTKFMDGVKMGVAKKVVTR